MGEAERQSRAEAQSSSEVVTDRTPQRRELDPAVDAAIREFVEQAEPETKAWFLALAVEDQIAFLNNPDSGPKAFPRV